MKKIVLIALLTFVSPAVIASNEAQAGACYSPAPYCGYPLHPMCICENNGFQCWWVCVK